MVNSYIESFSLLTVVSSDLAKYTTNDEDLPKFCQLMTLSLNILIAAFEKRFSSLVRERIPNFLMIYGSLGYHLAEMTSQERSWGIRDLAELRTNAFSYVKYVK